MNIIKNLTAQNYNTGKLGRIKYIVIHYTGNNNDTAYNNTEYFKAYRGASAHYFIDENNIYQSIEDNNIAWHCGAKQYFHTECRNDNSIGIELCSYINNSGNYDFKAKTVDNAVWLVKNIMKKYNIPVGNILRHYDITKKICPEPFVRNTKAWEIFKSRLTEETDTCTVEKKNFGMFGKIRPVDTIEQNGCSFIKFQDLNNTRELAAVYNIENNLFELNFSFEKLNIMVNNEEKILNKTINVNGADYVSIKELAEVCDIEYNADTKTIRIS